jgi:excisionase family DNA binding protein
MNSSTQSLLSVSEACSLLGVSRPTVYRLIKAGKLRAIKIGGARRVRRDDVEGLLKECGKTDGVCSEKEFLTVEEVGAIVGFSSETVRKLIISGRLPSFKLGGARRIRRSDLEVFLSGG